MIIWNGWGILVVLIAAVFTVPLGFLASEVLGSDAAGLAAATTAFPLWGPEHSGHPSRGRPRPFFYPGGAGASR